MNVIEFNSVYKKFKKGEKFNSIRDSLPNFFRKTIVKNELDEREFWAVKNVNFDIKKGDVVGIMGPNGAGKSTILKLLSRIIVPTKGSMTINGRLSALIEVTAGFHPELTGRENVYLNGTILGMRRKEIDEKFDEIVEFSGVSEFIDTPVKRYSSGMYSRLGFSVAAHMDPEILLVDEVLAVGDMAFQAKCAQKMRELLSSGSTIVLVSHQLDMIQSLCKRAVLLNHGEVQKDGPVGEVIPHYQNIVNQQNEEEMRRKINLSENRVKVDTAGLIDIHKVIISDGQKNIKNDFSTEDSIVVEFQYETKKHLEQPIIIFNITRADGVLCCSSRSDKAGLKINTLNGVGNLRIHLGQIFLAPGIYLIKISIWDKEMIHPYIERSKEIIRIQTNESITQSPGVFMPKITWEIK
ncbi:MAG: ABC transporter ATP-binding protein [Candidatus Omnitrophica bacterium]|nr:ABC transporter ATP-binding protein [Candidatus Omnitrophota bacterium]